MKLNTNYSLLLFVFAIISCTTAEIPLDGDPDVIDRTITYNRDVKTIIDANCTTCHGNVTPNAGLRLTTFQQVKNSAQNGNLISRMNNAANPMPPSGVLSTTTRAIIDKWAEDGYLEN